MVSTALPAASFLDTNVRTPSIHAHVTKSGCDTKTFPAALRSHTCCALSHTYTYTHTHTVTHHAYLLVDTSIVAL